MEYNFMSVPSYYSTSSYAIVEKDLISQLENTNYQASNVDANLSLQTPFNVKKCLSCGTTKTPMWRKGPEGPKTLCNACGLRFRKEELRAMTMLSLKPPGTDMQPVIRN